jgi:hypothetical protein
LHSATELSAGITGDFHSAFPLNSGHLLVSFRASETDRYAVYSFDPEKKVPGEPVFSSPDFDIIDAIAVSEHARPKKLPSEVDMGVKTGLLLCQDVNFTDIRDRSFDLTLPKADRIEVIGVDSSLGVINVENDGSFYLKVTADKPFRIKTFDKEGHVLDGPGSWIWIRPNERRLS